MSFEQPPKPPYIVLTSPHSYCKSRMERDCDRAAMSAILYLSQLLKKSKIDHFVHMATHLRGDYLLGLDMNRMQARRSKYRRELTQIIKLYRGKISLSLDIHSFPPMENLDMYLLNETKRTTDDEESLKNFLRKRGIRIIIKDGARRCRTVYCKSNDIRDEFRANGIPSILIEFRERKRGESSPDHKAFIKRACDGILQWILKKKKVE